MKTLIKALALGAIVVCSSIANAGILTVIGDVDAINTTQRPGNFSLLENIRGGASDILWLTGGGNFTPRDTNLRAQWGVTTDTGSTLTETVAGRDLIVVSAEWARGFSFDATAISDLTNYLGAGGDMLFVGQLCRGCNGFDPQALYNDFLSDIGSIISYTGGFVSSGNYTPDQATLIGAGAGDFYLNGVSSSLGGVSVVEDGAGRVGVAYEEYTPVPAPASLLIAFAGLFLIGLNRRASRS